MGRAGTTPVTGQERVIKSAMKNKTTTVIEDTTKPQNYTSKSYSLSKSYINHKDVVDLKGPINNEMFFSVKTSPVEEDYEIKQLLGEGSFGQVKLVTHKRTGLDRAMKIIKKAGIADEERANMLKEVTILKSLDHPNILKIFDMHEDDEQYYLLTEYCAGGELFDRIDQAKSFSEKDAAKYIKQLLSAIAYLHARNIVHRDLKAENLLFESPAEDANLKLIDFGVSSECLKGNKLKETLGTPYYIAPEVLLQSYDEKCDIWSCGIILYVLLCGYPPFNGDNDQEILESVKKADLIFYGTPSTNHRGRMEKCVRWGKSLSYKNAYSESQTSAFSCRCSTRFLDCQQLHSSVVEAERVGEPDDVPDEFSIPPRNHDSDGGDGSQQTREGRVVGGFPGPRP